MGCLAIWTFETLGSYLQAPTVLLTPCLLAMLDVHGLVIVVVSLAVFGCAVRPAFAIVSPATSWPCSGGAMLPAPT
jgi:hypothetical protein